MKNSKTLQLQYLENRDAPATGIWLEATSNVLYIEGSNTNDVARVRYDTKVDPITGKAVEDRSTLLATLQTDFGWQTEARYPAASVNYIQYHGRRGNDLFTNQTAILSTTTCWTGGTVNSSLLLGSPGNNATGQEGKVGVFTVGSTGQVDVDYLYRGAGYNGELGFFNLEGMDAYATGSTAYIKEAARRALSGSNEGYVVIRASQQGARFSATLPWEGNLNRGTYIGPQTVKMLPGTRFAAILVPNGTLNEVFKDPTLGGSKRPLFSIPEANPYAITPQMRGQVGDLDGHGSVFAFEDLRLDGSSDRDYNDMVFQILGARGVATHAAEVISSTRNFIETPIGQSLLNYAAERARDDSSVVAGAGQDGVFKIDASGEVKVNYLFDGGGYVGEMAIFSVQGMEHLVPGSREFIQEAARRALSGSQLGHVLISDRLEAARVSSKLSWETNFNSGIYLGEKKFKMSAGDSVAFFLVPNGTIWELFNNPDLTGGKRPLFSLASANPTGPTGNIHFADFTGQGQVFGFEDQRKDGTNCDRDFNDLVFRISGLTGKASLLTDVVQASKNTLLQPIAESLLAV